MAKYFLTARPEEDDDPAIIRSLFCDAAELLTGKQIDPSLLGLFTELRERRIGVVVFSDENAAAATEALTVRGLPAPFLPVRPGEEFAGQYPYGLVDMRMQDGLFCDIGETLLMANFGKGSSRGGYYILNPHALGLLKRAHARGIKVTVFTGGKPSEMAKELLELGFPEKFLPIRSKSDFKGKRLQGLIDNEPPGYQMFMCDNWIRIRQDGRIFDPTKATVIIQGLRTGLPGPAQADVSAAANRIAGYPLGD